MTPILRTTVVDVDLDAIAANTRAVRARAGVDVIAVVKGDGYGHGAEAVGEAAMDAGAAALAVATVEEAIVLHVPRTRPRRSISRSTPGSLDSARRSPRPPTGIARSRRCPA